MSNFRSFLLNHKYERVFIRLHFIFFVLLNRPYSASKSCSGLEEGKRNKRLRKLVKLSHEGRRVRRIGVAPFRLKRDWDSMTRPTCYRF